MTLDRSLRIGGAMSRQRSVLTRAERIAKLTEEGKFDPAADCPMGLPKVAVKHSKAGHKVKKEEKAEGAEAAEAAPAAGAAAPAASAKGAAAKGAADKGAPAKGAAAAKGAADKGAAPKAKGKGKG